MAPRSFASPPTGSVRPDRLGSRGNNAIPRHQRRQLVLNHPDRREDGRHSKANCTSSDFESHSTGWEGSIWGIQIHSSLSALSFCAFILGNSRMPHIEDQSSRPGPAQSRRQPHFSRNSQTVPGRRPLGQERALTTCLFTCWCAGILMTESLFRNM